MEREREREEENCLTQRPAGRGQGNNTVQWWKEKCTGKMYCTLYNLNTIMNNFATVYLKVIKLKNL